MSVTLQVAGQHDNIHPPQHHGDAGLDLVAAEGAYLPSDGRPQPVRTGVRVAIPVGYAGFVLPRSGMGKRGIIVPNSPGLIDSGYRGEIVVLLANVTDQGLNIQKGERVAQLVVMPVPATVLDYVLDLDETDRGEQGFGSTGR